MTSAVLCGCFAYYNVTNSQIDSYENSYSRETGEQAEAIDNLFA